jgi:hypothetical protein
MVEEIGGINNNKKPHPQNNDLNLTSAFYAEEILKNFLISKKTPNSPKEKNEIEKISKNLSLLIWLGQSKILPLKEEKNIKEQLKDLCENFHSDTLQESTNIIIQNLKNINSKTKILEHIIDIAYILYNQNIKNSPPITHEILHEKFNKVIEKIKLTSDDFSLIKLERNVKEIKKNFLNNQENITILIQHLENL